MELLGQMGCAGIQALFFLVHGTEVQIALHHSQFDVQPLALQGDGLKAFQGFASLPQQALLLIEDAATFAFA